MPWQKRNLYTRDRALNLKGGFWWKGYWLSTA